MSQQGIERAVAAFLHLQQAKEELMRMATAPGVDTTGKQSHQDLRLGHLMTKANDAIKDEFMEILQMAPKQHWKRS